MGRGFSDLSFAADSFDQVGYEFAGDHLRSLSFGVMAFFGNDAVNRVNLHYAIQSLAQAGGGLFFTVYLLQRASRSRSP